MFLLWGLLGVVAISIILPMLIYWVRVWLKGFPDSDNYFSFAGWIVFLGAIAILMTAIIAPNTYEKTHYEVPVGNLVSMQDGVNVSGSFFLGCGTIEGKPTYTYYMEDLNGWYSFNSMPASIVLIKFTKEGEPPKLVELQHHFKNIALDYWFFESLDNDFWYSYIFYVPENSIKTDFVLDAK